MEKQKHSELLAKTLKIAMLLTYYLLVGYLVWLIIIPEAMSEMVLTQQTLRALFAFGFCAGFILGLMGIMISVDNLMFFLDKKDVGNSLEKVLDLLIFATVPFIPLTIVNNAQILKDNLSSAMLAVFVIGYLSFVTYAFAHVFGKVERVKQGVPHG